MFRAFTADLCHFQEKCIVPDSPLFLLLLLYVLFSPVFHHISPATQGHCCGNLLHTSFCGLILLVTNKAHFLFHYLKLRVDMLFTLKKII